MNITQAQLTKEVKRRIPKKVLNKVIAYIKEHQPPLWAMHCGKWFYCQFTLIMLYKDCYAVGFSCLYSCVSKWISCSSCSLHHNIYVLHHVLKDWGKSQVKLSNACRWKSLVTNLKLTGATEGGCLWMDSFNLRLSGVSCGGCKEDLWSYKLNLPGQRFMAILDAQGWFCALWGGYSPKLYDGEFLKIQSDWIEVNLKGVTVLTNNHFLWGKMGFHDLKFVTTLKRGKGSLETGEGLGILTQEAEVYNRTLSSARAHVENGFGRVIGVFDVLAVVWHEDEGQQNACVWTAVGIVNCRLE